VIGAIPEVVMRGASPGKFWWFIAGLTVLLVAGQVLWATLAWNSAGMEGPPIPAPKPSDRGEGATFETWRKIYDPFPPIVDFGIASAEEAGSTLADDEYVLGVEIDGQSRAYPLNMMGQPGSEVVNDSLGGRPIAVTFCGLCEAPLVFSRRVDDRTLTFHVSGVLVDSNMLIKDVETRSGWVQLLGKAIEGPLKGKVLERFASTWTDWKTWRAEHPATTAIRLKRRIGKYSPGRPGTASSSKKRGFIEALQWGLAVRGKARSWPFSGLERERVVNDSFDGRPLLIVFDPESLGPAGFDRRLDDRELTFRWRDGGLVDEATGSTWEPSTGRAIRGPLEGRRLTPVAGTIATTAIWRAFHPEVETWSPPDSAKQPPSKGQ
jgi:Protein of unknown function (DUF3179)